MLKEKEMELKKLLNENGRIVIKKENDYMLAVVEAKIEDKIYHIGTKIESLEDLMDKINHIVKSGLLAIRRRKKVLMGGT